MSENEVQPRFLTIRQMFKDFLDTIGVQCFRFAFDGQCYASTAKRQARVSIGLPKTIVNTNLKDLDKFAFFGVAIPRNIINEYLNKEEVET